MKTFLVLVPLLGIPFLLGPFVEYSIYIAYVFVAMNGLSVSLKILNFDFNENSSFLILKL